MVSSSVWMPIQKSRFLLGNGSCSACACSLPIHLVFIWWTKGPSRPDCQLQPSRAAVRHEAERGTAAGFGFIVSALSSAACLEGGD